MKVCDIINWIKNSKETDSYMMSLKRMVQRGVAFERNLPILVSSVKVYQNHLKEVAHKKQLKKIKIC